MAADIIGEQLRSMYQNAASMPLWTCADVTGGRIAPGGFNMKGSG